MLNATEDAAEMSIFQLLTNNPVPLKSFSGAKRTRIEGCASTRNVLSRTVESQDFQNRHYWGVEFAVVRRQNLYTLGPACDRSSPIEYPLDTV